MVVGREKSHQLADLRVVGANRVQASVGFELKPSNVFVRGGLQVEWHVEAGHMIIEEEVGALRVMSPSRELELESDGFGFDPEFTERVKNVALWFYRKYWRGEVDGVEDMAPRARALVVAEHTGALSSDGAVIPAAVPPRHPH